MKRNTKEIKSRGWEQLKQKRGQRENRGRRRRMEREKREERRATLDVDGERVTGQRAQQLRHGRTMGGKSGEVTVVVMRL